MANDPYQTLGVSKSATQDEIRNAYRRLAKKHHPDLNPGNSDAERKFKDINAAYELIGSSESRQKFDRGEIGEATGYDRRETPRGSQPFYYETQHGGGRYSRPFGGIDEDFFANFAFPGQDVTYRMDVDFKDAVLGATREIALPEGKRFEVRIPPGIESGTKLRFRGQGEPGQGRNATPGDLYVEVHVRPSDRFRVRGQDLEIDVPISLGEAILGGEIRVPTVDGSVMLRIPPGVNTGTRLRVKGKGIPNRSGSGRGDQIVALSVHLPPRPDPELQEAIRRWSETHGYNPRMET